MDADRFLFTPSGLYKRRLKSSQILVVNGDGELVRGKGRLKPSSELLMHLEAYRQRDDFGAMLHAHPPYSTALTIAGIPFPDTIVPEVLALLGEVATAPCAIPGIQDLAQSISEPIRTHNTVLLSNHGSLTVGRTFEQALIALERMDFAAQLYYLAFTLGKINPLLKAVIQRLRSLKSGKMVSWFQTSPI